MRQMRIIHWLGGLACLAWGTQAWAVDPAHWWKMQEASGGTTLADTGTTGGKTATINTGTFTTKTGPGSAGSATASAIDLTGYYFSFTAATLADNANWSVFWRQQNDTAGTGGCWGISGGAIPGLQFNSATQIGYRLTGAAAGTFAISNGGTTWHSYMVVHDTSDNFKLYVDGSLVETDTSYNCSNPFTYIGLRNATVADGGICDFRIYLSDESENAAAIHNEGLTGGATTKANFYRMMRGGQW